MSIKSVQAPSFKAYVPVFFYAKDKDSDTYDRVTSPEAMRRCQGFVIRNLNGTAKSMANDRFVKGYSNYDADYRKNPQAVSHYDYDKAMVMMITGDDVETVNKMAKPIGIAKGDAMDRTGVARSFESKMATRSYFNQLKSFLRNSCKQVCTQDGENLALKVYFTPKYRKDGKVAKFNYDKACFTKCKPD